MSGTTTLNEKRNDLLKLLIQSITATSGGPALATEATLLNVLGVLNSLFAEQRLDFEVKCIKDANGDFFLMRIAWDDAADSYTTDYIDATGTVVIPVAPLELCNPDMLLNAILTELQTLNTVDFATAANQALAITALNSIITNTTGLATEVTLGTLLTNFNATDFATEATLASFLAAFNAEDFASQTTLAALLTAFNAEDFASETTLAAFSAAFGATDFATEVTAAAILAGLNTLNANFTAEDFASETTLSSVLALLTAEDFASETTLNALLTAFNAKDFASETTLASVLTELQSIDTRLTGSQRVLSTVNATVDGSTLAGVQSVSLLFLGNNGTLDGAPVLSRTSFDFTPNKGEDTVGSIAYTVPTTGQARIIITYVN